MKVLDAVRDDGARLVEMVPDAAAALRSVQPGMRLVPVVYYRPAVAPRVTVAEPVKTTKALVTTKVVLSVVSRSDGQPVDGVLVVALTDFTKRIGAQGITDKQGKVSLALGGAQKIERLYIYPEKGYWSLLKRNLAVAPALQFGLLSVDLEYTDGLRHFYGYGKDDDGNSVKVGVVDTGVGPHPDLIVAGGENTVLGESPLEYANNGKGHGTHVAGIIAARGTPPSGLRGLAPAVTLYSYRVFGQAQDSASSYSIIKAIDRAVAAGCDLINLSLGGGPADDATRSAIEDARAAGSVVIAAAGNDGRQAVSYPAAEAMALAVAALGRKGTFPSDSTAVGDVMKPFGTDKQDFAASFSNIGPEIDLIGPGVDILSTVPGGYASMSGTSMACPAVTGVAARLLSTRRDLLKMPRNQARSDAIIRALLKMARALGFGPAFEGRGLP